MNRPATPLAVPLKNPEIPLFLDPSIGFYITPENPEPID